MFPFKPFKGFPFSSEQRYWKLLQYLKFKAIVLFWHCLPTVHK